jgi:4'-phosphopantetheinyl transferase
LSVTDPPLPFETLRSVLSEDERARTGRLHFPADADRVVLARAGLRSLLAAHLGTSPHEVAFRYEPKGKPILISAESPGINFSVSHSGEWVLIGIANRHRVGVDIERMREIRDFRRVVNRYFAARETAFIGALPDAHQRDAFFACWTRKEAYVKALGGGLSMGLNRFVVSAGFDEHPAILEIDGSEEAAARWTVWAGTPAPGYVAAAAADAAGIKVVPRYWLGTSGVVPWSVGAAGTPQ